MNPSQSNRREGRFPIKAAVSVVDKAGYLVKLIDGGTEVKAGLPEALTDNAHFLIVDEKDGAINTYIDVEPLYANQAVRIKAKGTGSAGGLVSLADPATPADAGKVIAAPAVAGTYRIIGHAFEDWTDGQLLKVIPNPSVLVIPP